MNDKARFEAHALSLGKLVGNLQSLEMGARMVIVKLDQRVAEQVQTQLPQVTAGEMVEINAFTNGDDLAQTLERYNKRAPLDCRIDISPIVTLRDALAPAERLGMTQRSPCDFLSSVEKQKAGKSWWSLHWTR